MSSAFCGARPADPALPFRHHILDEAGDDPPGQLVDAAGEIEIRIAGLDLLQQRRQERHLAQILDPEQPRPQAVVEVMGVIGDVVGDGRGLGLAAGMGGEFQVLLGVVFEDRQGHAAGGVAQGRLALPHRGAGRYA